MDLTRSHRTLVPDTFFVNAAVADRFETRQGSVWSIRLRGSRSAPARALRLPLLLLILLLLFVLLLPSSPQDSCSSAPPCDTMTGSTFPALRVACQGSASPGTQRQARNPPHPPCLPHAPPQAKVRQASTSQRMRRCASFHVPEHGAAPDFAIPESINP